MLRIRCDAKVAQCPLGDKFGCDPINDAPGLLMLAMELELDVGTLKKEKKHAHTRTILTTFRFQVIGISFHVGSGCMDPPVYAKAIYTAKSLFQFAAKQVGFKLTLLDIGGGFPGDKNTDLLEVT